MPLYPVTLGNFDDVNSRLIILEKLIKLIAKGTERSGSFGINSTAGAENPKT